jgi:hypothetical protein
MNCIGHVKVCFRPRPIWLYDDRTIQFLSWLDGVRLSVRGRRMEVSGLWCLDKTPDLIQLLKPAEIHIYSAGRKGFAQVYACFRSSHQLVGGLERLLMSGLLVPRPRLAEELSKRGVRLPARTRALLLAHQLQST